MGMDTTGNGNSSVRGIVEEDKKLVFSYENLTEFPIPNLLEQVGVSDTEVLDLSHNRLSDVNFIVHFPKLTTLIMDHNLLTADIKLPTVSKTLTTLWVNHNRVDKLYPFIHRINRAFPNLKYLSLMGNTGAPSYLNGGTYYQYLQYRLFVISQMANLVCLDDLRVTRHQRQEAHRLFSRPYLQTLISLPFPQYLFHVQQKVKLYLRDKSSSNNCPSDSATSRRSSSDSAGSSNSSVQNLIV